MSQPPEYSDDDIAADVLPALVEEAAVPIELTELFPWHKPRKQYVRRFQWAQLSKGMVGKLKDKHMLPTGSDSKPEVKLLTLPGIDYFDAQIIAESCHELGCALTSTGFLGPDVPNPQRARAQVRQDSLIKRGTLSDRSHTLWHRLEEASDTGSAAYGELKKRGPFDIINIDACGSLAAPSADHARRVIDVIYRLVELQLGRRAVPWMLFVTADVRREDVNSTTLANLFNAIRANAAESVSFASELMAHFSDFGGTTDDALNGLMDDDGAHFVRAFSLGAAKWLMHLAAEKQWSVRMHSSYYYSSGPFPYERPTMPSLAFEFVPPPPGLQDSHDVTNQTPLEGGSETDFALHALSKMGSMIDLDSKMKTEPAKRAEMLEQTQRLLVDAGYATIAVDRLALLDGISGPDAAASS